MAVLISYGIVADAANALAQARENMRGQVQVTSDALSKEIAAYQHDARLLVLEKEELMAAILSAADPNDFVFYLAGPPTAGFPSLWPSPSPTRLASLWSPTSRATSVQPALLT